MFSFLRARSLRFFCKMFVVFLFVAGVAGMHAQTQIAGSATATAPGSVLTPSGVPTPCEEVRPVAAEIASAVDAIDIDRWKLPREGKDQLDENVDSIRLDVSSTLPGLLDQAKAAPTELAQQWLVVQNVNALYDVLVRVTTTANLAASRADASVLTDAENQLGEVRKHLTATLIAATENQDREIVALAVRLAAVSQVQGGLRTDNKTIVVNDDTKPLASHRTKTAHGSTKKAPPSTGNVTR